jgi:iron complex outermembrane recepter protein
MKSRHLIHGAISLLAVAAATHPLSAQDAPQTADESVEDGGAIIVTARLREEEIQDVPLGINAFDAGEIERQNLVRLDDLAQVTAGLTFDIGGFPNDTRPALRGMQAERGRPSVAILLDGQDLSGENLSIAGGTSSLRTDLFDLERIEVVKGPQATLYGRNAFAGAINYISKRPEFEPGARGMVEVGEGGLVRATASLTGPIIDDILAMRVNIAMKDFKGYYDNPVNGGRLGGEHSEGYAISALFKPDPSLSISARFQQVKAQMTDLPTAFIFSNARLPVPGGTFAPPGPPGTPMQPCPASLNGLPAATVAACTRGTVVGRISARERNVQMSLNPLTGLPPFGMRSNTRLASAKVEWDAGSIGTFVYSYGFLKDRSLIEQDGDFTSTPAPPGLVLSISALQSLDYSNEHDDHTLYWLYNSDRLNLLLGLQKFDETSTLRNSSQFFLRNPVSPLAGPPFRLRTAPVNNPAFPVLITRETDYVGYFGGFSFEVIDGLRLSAEVRQNKDTIDYTTTGQRRQDVSLSNLTPVCIPTLAPGATNPGNPALQPPLGTVVACPAQIRIKDNRWTPRVTVDYHFNPDVVIYASYAEGFKPGGVNTNEVVSFVGQDYRAETVETIEVGLKSAWFDKRLVFNIDAYRNRYKDQQIGVQLTSAGAGGAQVTTAGIINAARVDIWGIEADLNWRIADPLTVGLNYAYTDATFDRYVQGPNAGSPAAIFAQCGVPVTQSGSTQNLAEAQNICGDFSDKRVGKNPKHSLNLSATFEQDFGDDNSWFIETTGSYRSKRFVDESNLAFLPSYFIGNLRGGVTIGNYSLTAYVDNVFDNRRIRSAQRIIDFGNPEGFAPGRGIIAYLPQPRSFGIRFGAEF